MAQALPVGTSTRDRTRARIVETAADLLARDGRDAVTTRAVAAGAAVQAPTLYRLFGDKDGLLDAVAEHGFQRYLAQKEVRTPGHDPVDDLRAGWDLHVGFGLAHPALYALMYGDPRPGTPSPAAARAAAVLRTHVRRIAETGRLRVGEDHAAALVHAGGCGTVFTLLAMPEGRRDPAVSDLAREAVIAAVTTDTTALPAAGAVGAATALHAALDDTTAPTATPTSALTAAERALLQEWLTRIAADA